MVGDPRAVDGNDPLMPTTPISPPGEWRYEVHDLLTGDLVAEHMPFKVDPFDRSLTEAGTLTASLPVDNAEVRLLDPWGRVLPRRTTIVPCRDDQPMGEYVIWNRPGYRASNKVMPLSCMELRSYFDKHRIIRPELGYGSRKTLSFTQQDAFVVFRSLLADAQGVTYQGRSVGDLGIEMDPTVMSGQLIDRRDLADVADAYHGYQFDYYGQLLDALAAAVGFEWRIDPYFGDNNALRRRLILGYPHIGRPQDADSLTLEYPGVIADYGIDEDGENSSNYVAGLGAGEEEAMIWGEAYNTPELLNGYPLLEGAVPHKDDTSPILAAKHAAAELGRIKGDIEVWSFDLVGTPNCAPGDYVRARISDEARFRGSSVTPHEVSARVTSMRRTPAPKERTTLTVENPREQA